MTTATISTPRIVQTPSRPTGRRAKVVIAAAGVLVAAAIGLVVWLLVPATAHHASTPTRPLTNVQKFGGADLNGNGLCQPAGGQHYC